MKKEKIKAKQIGSLKFASVINIVNAVLCVVALVFMVSIAFLSHNKLYEKIFGWDESMIVLFGFVLFPALLIISIALIMFYSIMFSGCLISFIVGLINGVCLGNISKSEINPYQYKTKRALAITSIILSVILIACNIAYLCNMVDLLNTFGSTANENNLNILKGCYMAILIMSCVFTAISLTILIVNMIKNWRKTEKDENGKLVEPSIIFDRKNQSALNFQTEIEKDEPPVSD